MWYVDVGGTRKYLELEMINKREESDKTTTDIIYATIA